MLKQFFLVVELLFFRVCIVYVLVGKVFLFSPIFIFSLYFFYCTRFDFLGPIVVCFKSTIILL